MAHNRRVEIRLHGVEPHAAPKANDPQASDTSKDKSTGMRCADLREHARWYRVHYRAWNYWIQDGKGMSLRKRGLHDPGLTSDSIKPSEMNVKWGALDLGYTSDEDFAAFYEQIVPISAGANLGQHMRALEEEARTLVRCSPSGG